MKKIGYIYAGESATLRFEARTEGEILDLSAYDVQVEISTTAMGPRLVKRSADGAVDMSEAARGTMFCALSAEDTASMTPGTATIGVRLLRDKKVQMAFDASIEILRQGAAPGAVLSRTAEPVIALHTPCIWVLMNFGAARDGITPHIGQNGNWYIGDEDTGVNAQGDATPDNVTESIVDRIIYDKELNPDHYRTRNFGVPAFEAGRTIFVVGTNNDHETKSCFAKMTYNETKHDFVENWNVQYEGANASYIDFSAEIPQGAKKIYVKTSAICRIRVETANGSYADEFTTSNGVPFQIPIWVGDKRVYIRAAIPSFLETAGDRICTINLYANHANFRRGIYRSLGYGKWEKLPNRGLVVKQRGGRIVWNGQNVIFHEREYMETAWFLRVKKHRVAKFLRSSGGDKHWIDDYVGYICVGRRKEDLFSVLGNPDGGPAGRRSIMKAVGKSTDLHPWSPATKKTANVEYADGFVATVRWVVHMEKGYSAIPRKVLYRFKVRPDKYHTRWEIEK